MAGYYDELHLDSCYELYQDRVNNGTYGYTMDRKPVMRENVTQAPLLRTGGLPDFYGPNVGKRIAQESILQGRGHCLNKCTECDVVYLPESLFPKHKSIQSTCDRVDMEPLYTRVPKACNGLMETDVSVYRFMPGSYKRGYQGYSAVVDTHIQTQMPPPDTRKPLHPCAQSYSTYGPQWDLRPYR